MNTQIGPRGKLERFCSETICEQCKNSCFKTSLKCGPIWVVDLLLSNKLQARLATTGNQTHVSRVVGYLPWISIANHDMNKYCPPPEKASLLGSKKTSGQLKSSKFLTWFRGWPSRIVLIHGCSNGMGRTYSQLIKTLQC